MLTRRAAKKIKIQCIGIIGKPRYPKVLITHKKICNWLLKQNYKIITEINIAKQLHLKNIYTENIVTICKKADLIIVIGGDGNMLNTARYISQYQNKIIGINQGNLGFLTDLKLDNALGELKQILLGYFYEEKRMLLEINVYKTNKMLFSSIAMNEVILYSDRISSIIEFDIYIDNKFAFSHRSDGIIISTPTGSTAYSLSAGGPILSPDIKAIILIPIFPHTLSSRPIIINSNSNIELKIKQKNTKLKLSCDSKSYISVYDNYHILIKKSNKEVNFIHPKNYNYFNILRTKLNWFKKNY